MTKGQCCCCCTILGSGSYPGAMGALIGLSALGDQPCAGANHWPCPIPKDLEVWHAAEVRTGCMSLFQQESLGRAWVSLAPWAGLGDRLSLSLRAEPARHRILGYPDHKPAFPCCLVAQGPVSLLLHPFL